MARRVPGSALKKLSGCRGLKTTAASHEGTWDRRPSGWSRETVAIWLPLQSSCSQVTVVNLAPGQTVYQWGIQHVESSRWIVDLNSFCSRATRGKVLRQDGWVFGVMSCGEENRGNKYSWVQSKRIPAELRERLLNQVLTSCESLF